MRTLLLAALCGCAAEAPIGPAPVFDPLSTSFFDTPWPSDDRLDPDGTLSVESFPDPWGVGILET